MQKYINFCKWQKNPNNTYEVADFFNLFITIWIISCFIKRKIIKPIK